jgi:hypothetical protein
VRDDESVMTQKSGYVSLTFPDSAKQWRCQLGQYSDEQYLAAARAAFQDDGDLEFDEGELPESRVSQGDDPGAYVLAWKWVEDGTVATVLNVPYIDPPEIEEPEL